jgi:pyruvate dehydrogenase E2 component (dihydrolipoamide acetyltransferase)
MARRQLILPELGLGDQPIKISLWLVEPGAQVFRGDSIVEVLAGAAVVDLPSPVDGYLAEVLAEEDETVHTGQALAVIESSEDF